MITIIIIGIHQFNLWHARPYFSALYGPSHLSFPTTLWRGTNVNSTLELKKLKLKGIKRLVQVHAANTRQDQESNENSLVENIWGGNRSNWWLTELSCLCRICLFLTSVKSPCSAVLSAWVLVALCVAISGLLCFQAQTPPLRLTYLIKVPNSFASVLQRSRGTGGWRQGAKVSCSVPSHWCP